MGRTAAELKARSSQECVLKCLSMEKCRSCRYRKGAGLNCILIYKKISTTEEGEIFEIDENSFIYERVCTQNSIGNWIQPFGWTGPCPALYRSFDNMDDMMFMEGTEQKNYASLVSGQVNSALTLNHTRRQWIDLGIHPEVCMTQLDTCDAAGCDISMWLRLLDCPDWAGILSSYDSGTGFQMYCRPPVMRVWVFLQDGIFQVYPHTPTGWTHIVVNYIGPDDGQGIRTYFDGIEMMRDTDKHGGPFTTGDSRIVVGRINTEIDNHYSTMQADELMFFNSILTNADIRALSAV